VTGIDAVPFRDVVERARHYHAAYLEASRPLHTQAWSLVGEKEGNWWKAVTTLPGGARAVAVPLLHRTRSGSRALLQVSLAGGAQTIATAASRCAQGTAVETHRATARSPAPATNRK